MFVPSKTIRITYGDSYLILLKNKNFARTKLVLLNHRNVILRLFLSVDQQTNFPELPIFVGFLKFHKFALVTDCYRLFCFWQILFFVCCLLILMHLWLVCRGWTIEKLKYSRVNTNINKEWVHYSTLCGGFPFLY